MQILIIIGSNITIHSYCCNGSNLVKICCFYLTLVAVTVIQISNSSKSLITFCLSNSFKFIVHSNMNDELMLFS